MRWLLLAALLCAPAAHALDPGAVELADQRTEYTTTYRMPGGLYATSSDGAPAHWWDGGAWREPDPTWRDGQLRGIPGPLVWDARESGRLIARGREGRLIGALGWAVTAEGPVARFDWQGLPCTLTATVRAQKLACYVQAPLGRTTLRVPALGPVEELADGGAVIGGLWRFDRLEVIGADGVTYQGVVGAWRAADGGLAVEVNDRALPPGAFPYVIDPSTGPNLPSTCASATGVGTVAWTSPGNATASDNTRTTANIGLNVQTNWLKCQTFGFSSGTLTADKIIKGITAEAEVSRSSGTGTTTIKITDARVVKADGTIATSNRAIGTSCTSTFTTSDVWRACGGSLDTWGESLAPADVTDPDFGVAFSAKNTGSTARDARIDAVRVTIFYAPPAGRVYLTGWDTYGSEGGTTTGSPEYIAGAARTGGAGLRLSAAASTTETWKPQAGTLDADLTDRGYARWYWATTPTMGATNQPLVVAYAQEDTNIGCYLTLTKSDLGCLTYRTRYHGAGSADVDFGEFTASSSASTTCATTLAGQAVAFGQVTTAGTVACPLYINGQLAQNYALEIASDCSGGACDLANFVLGSPATSSVDDYASFPSYTLDIDDFVIDNLIDPGVGYVTSIRPDASGDTTVWNNTGSCTGVTCIQDWASGAADACTGSGVTARSRSSTVGEDLWNYASISPALTATESITALRPVLWACENSGTGSSVRLRWRSNGLCTGSTTPYACCTGSGTGTCDDYGADDTLSASSTKWLEQTRAESPVSTTAWTEAEVNGLQVGYEKYASGGTDSRASAALIYVDVRQPAAQPDRNLQDLNGDGHLTAVTWCDSITAGTRTSTCESTDGTSTCTAPCSSDATCDGGSCVNGACVMECETNADCTCGTTAQCLTANNWVNQFSLRAPQFDTLINCGRNAMPLPWALAHVSTIVGDPYALAPPCKLIRGDWGHCSSTTTQACGADGDCPAGQTCVRYAADYVIGPCGANNFRGSTPSDCKSIASLLVTSMPALTDYWGNESCPRAATSAGTWRVAKTSCSVDADCAGVSADSKCRGTCNGHSDPLWPCLYDGNCSTCSNDSEQHCGDAGYCINNGAKISQALWTYERCNDDSDCSAGTCETFASLEGAWDNAYNENCTSCTHYTCDTATKYCTIPCNAVSCSTDADCVPPGGGAPGLCNTGTGKCEACGAGEFFDATESDTTSTAARQLMFAKRLAASPGNLTPDKLITDKLALDAAVRAQGAHYLDATYMVSWQNGQDVGLRDSMEKLAHVALAKMPMVVDTHNAGKFYEDRIGGGRYGELVGIDGVHNAAEGASVMSFLIGASINTLYPVCSGDTSDVCGFCDVACTTDTQANPPVVGTSPTPTPVSNACRTATPGTPVAGCTTSANCGAGCACEDVDPGAGTDKRCVCEDIAQCPSGDNTRARKRKATDALCASGTCSVEMVPPLCTMSKVRCSTTADCQGYRKGDVCAPAGIWQACEVGADCTRDGGKYADPVCAPPLVGATTPTPQMKVCQQPTPTP